MNKVRFGLKNVMKAEVIRDGDTVTFGELTPIKGAQSMTMNREGSDSQDIYADDTVYYTIAGTNGGYTVEMQFVHLDDQTRQELLGETSINGVSIETADQRAPEFAYVMEMQGDTKPIAACFYCGTASRPNTSANTKGETPSPDTDTLSVRFIAVDLPIDGKEKPVIKANIEYENNPEAYEKWFEQVLTPADLEKLTLPTTPTPPAGGGEEEEPEGE